MLSNQLNDARRRELRGAIKTFSNSLWQNPYLTNFSFHGYSLHIFTVEDTENENYKL